MILTEEHNVPGAIDAFDSYLKHAGAEHDAETARKQLAELEHPRTPALALTVDLAPAAQGLRAGIHIQSDHLTLTEREGHWLGQLELTITLNGSGNPMSFRPMPIQLRFTPEVLERVKKAGLTLNQNFRVPDGVSAVRVAVRDVPSGAVGAMTLEWPPK